MDAHLKDILRAIYSETTRLTGSVPMCHWILRVELLVKGKRVGLRHGSLQWLS